MDLLAKLLIGFVVIVAIALLMSLPVYYLWNDLMPKLFALKKIDFTQALELSCLCSCLFKSSSSSSKD